MSDEHELTESTPEPPADASSDPVVASLDSLMHYLVTNLVDEPENATIDLQRRGSAVQIQLRLPEDDLGKVIGRGGRIAKSIRTALMVSGSRNNLRVSLDIERHA